MDDCRSDEISEGPRRSVHGARRKDPPYYRLGGGPADQERVLLGTRNIDMPRKKLVIPTFKSEGEEAAWWERHRSAVETDLRAAMREGKTLSLQNVMAQARQKKVLLPVTIRLASEDIATARELADNKGIGYQTYIKLLLHEALRKEASHQARDAGK
jgi:predicted DNA binding CopG/RHH family protein